MKCNQSRPGFELVSPCSFSTTITITPQALEYIDITYSVWFVPYKSIFILCLYAIYWPNRQVGRVFAISQGDRGSILGRVIPKIQKMARCLLLSTHTVHIQGKVEESRIRNSALYLKANLRVTLDYGDQLYLYIYIYIYIYISHTHTHTCTHIYIYVCVYVCVWERERERVCVCVCVCLPKPLCHVQNLTQNQFFKIEFCWFEFCIFFLLDWLPIIYCLPEWISYEANWWIHSFFKGHWPKMKPIRFVQDLNQVNFPRRERLR